MIKNLIWDFDGTICNTYPSMVNGIKKALNKLGFDADKEEILSKAKIMFEVAFEYYSEKFDLGDKLYKTFVELKKDPRDRPPYEYVIDICKFINSRGGKNIIITHRAQDSTHKILEYYNMTDLFLEIVTADNNFRRKPDSHAFDYIMAKYRFERSETLGIGDRDLDILAAKRAGIITCYFDELGKTIPTTPDIHINNFKDLYEKLKEQGLENR